MKMRIAQRLLARNTDPAVSRRKRDPAAVAVPAKYRFAKERHPGGAGCSARRFARWRFALENVAVELHVLLEVRGHVLFREDRRNGTLRLARAAVDAFVRVNE